MEQNVEMSLVRERMLALLATFFAALALILACIGLYGVMAYRVARRTREIGIRIAVGARPESVEWMMVRETLLLVTIGAALGTLASLAANRYIAGQLFGVTPRDPMAIAVALSVLVIVTVAAGYVPARQASRIDPVRALRTERRVSRIGPDQDAFVSAPNAAHASTRITSVSGTTPSWAIASAAAALCMTAFNASMSGTSITTATRFGFCGSTNVRMLVTPSDPNSSFRFGERSQ